MLSLTGLLERAAQIGGETISVIDDDGALTWREFEERTAKSAGMFKDLGLEPGGCVALLLRNSVKCLELMFAVTRAGGIIVPIVTRFAAPEIIGCLNDCQARILCAEPLFLEPISSELTEKTTVEYMISCGSENAGGGGSDTTIRSYEDLFAKSVPLPDAGRGDDDVAAIFYTSGTTGRPKGVMMTHKGIVTNKLQWISALGLTRHENLMVVAPMFHAAGATNAIGATALGCKAIFVGTFDLDAMLADIEKYQITKIGLIVVMLEMIGRHPNLTDYDLSSVKKITYGGSPITESALETSQAIFPNAEFYQVYGQSEGGPTVSILPPECHVPGSDKIRSAGLPVIGTEIMIADENGHSLQQGEVGEIWVAGPGVSPGYLNLDTETRKSRSGKWLKTGDAGCLDQDGFLYIQDRIKDMIISGGENVYPSEIENVLMKFDGMMECAVIGIPSEKWGEQVHAIVRLDKDVQVSEDELVAHCREWLAGYKIPRSVEFWTEPLPVSPSAKILKSKLREPHWKDQERKI